MAGGLRDNSTATADDTPLGTTSPEWVAPDHGPRAGLVLDPHSVGRRLGHPRPKSVPGPGRQLRYVLGETIGEGGMGEVRRARDTELGRDLAAKLLLERHRDDPELVRRFVEVAQIGGQFNNPNIPARVLAKVSMRAAPITHIGRHVSIRRPPLFLALRGKLRSPSRIQRSGSPPRCRPKPLETHYVVNWENREIYLGHERSSTWGTRGRKEKELRRSCPSTAR